MSRNLGGDIIPLLAAAQQLPRDIMRCAEFTALEMKRRAAIEDRVELGSVTKLLTQLVRSSVSTAGLLRCKALGGDRRLAQRDL